MYKYLLPASFFASIIGRSWWVNRALCITFGDKQWVSVVWHHLASCFQKHMVSQAYNGNWADDMRHGQAGCRDSEMAPFPCLSDDHRQYTTNPWCIRMYPVFQGQMGFGDGAQYSGGWLHDARHGYGSYRLGCWNLLLSSCTGGISNALLETFPSFPGKWKEIVGINRF